MRLDRFTAQPIPPASPSHHPLLLSLGQHPDKPPCIESSADDLGMSPCQMESIRCSMIQDNCCLANRLQLSETFDDVQFLLR
jgi:hypothetical protein